MEAKKEPGKTEPRKKLKLSQQPAFRVGLVIVIVLVAFALVQQASIPKSFGEYGYYRGDNVDEWAAMKVSYADENKTCASCHGDRYQAVKAAEHGQVSCQTCHGAAGEHPQNPAAWQPKIEASREFCGACHNAITGRSGGNIKTIDVEKHNANINCTQCHDPHQPWAKLGGGNK